MNDVLKTDRKAMVIQPGQGRNYDMGGMRATFFADSPETDNRYSISEWSLGPMTEGPGAHSHEEDHIFYVIAGTVTLEITGERTDAEQGAYAVIPSGILHDFSNQGQKGCRFICINTPAGFEQMMPSLVDWFDKNTLGQIKKNSLINLTDT